MTKGIATTLTAFMSHASCRGWRAVLARRSNIRWAVCIQLLKKVIEIVAELATFARGNLAKAGVNNVKVVVGNGLALATLAATMEDDIYDVIVLSGSLPLLPQYLTAHLKIGGRMIVIVGDEVNMEVQLVVRVNAASSTAASLFETVAPALLNGPRSTGFTL